MVGQLEQHDPNLSMQGHYYKKMLVTVSSTQFNPLPDNKILD